MVKGEEKAHTGYATRRAASKAIKERLIGRSRLVFTTSRSASPLILYLKSIP